MSQLMFRYSAIDQRGAKSRGVLRAADRNAAYRQISAAGLKPLRIVARRSRRLSVRSAAIGTRDLAHLTYQFGILIEAGIPIAEGLRSIAEQEHNRRLQSVIEEIAGQIEAGHSITEAFNPHRALFGDVYVETLHAAETSGNMIKVLERLAEMLEQQYEMTKEVRGAMIYPVCVVVAMALAITFLMIFVVPQFASLYGNRGVELPLPTRLLMGVSGGLRTFWHVLLAGIIGGAWGFRWAWRTPAYRNKIEIALHKIPVVRDVLTGLAVSRFAHVFGTCVQSGLGLLEALELSGRSSGRPLLEADTRKMREQVKQGGMLTDVLVTCTYLPGFARRMIAAGEESAELPKMCGVVARHYDREVSHMTKNLATIIEPLLVVGLAGIVLVVALAIFLPMWNMAALM